MYQCHWLYTVATLYELIGGKEKTSDILLGWLISRGEDISPKFWILDWQYWDGQDVRRDNWGAEDCLSPTLYTFWLSNTGLRAWDYPPLNITYYNIITVNWVLTTNSSPASALCIVDTPGRQCAVVINSLWLASLHYEYFIFRTNSW